MEMQPILACVSCGGVWLDTAQTFLVFKRLKGGEAFIRESEELAARSRAQRPPTEGTAICPIGGEEMVLCEAQGIRIDQCAEHGTWFDARELGRIVDLADAPSVLDNAVDAAKETAQTALARSKQWLSKVLWGKEELPR